MLEFLESPRPFAHLTSLPSISLFPWFSFFSFANTLYFISLRLDAVLYVSTYLFTRIICFNEKRNICLGLQLVHLVVDRMISI